MPQKALSGENSRQQARKSAAVSISTNGYRKLKRRPQQRARPRSTNQLRIGILSCHLIGAPQAQCEPGVTTDWPAGMRWMQTLRKLPMQAPSKNTTSGKNHGKAAVNAA